MVAGCEAPRYFGLSLFIEKSPTPELPAYPKNVAGDFIPPGCRLGEQSLYLNLNLHATKNSRFYLALFASWRFKSPLNPARTRLL
jgi:hypothetical protein